MAVIGAGQTRRPFRRRCTVRSSARNGATGRPEIGMPRTTFIRPEVAEISRRQAAVEWRTAELEARKA